MQPYFFPRSFLPPVCGAFVSSGCLSRPTSPPLPSVQDVDVPKAKPAEERPVPDDDIGDDESDDFIADDSDEDNAEAAGERQVCASSNFHRAFRTPAPLSPWPNTRSYFTPPATAREAQAPRHEAVGQGRRVC